MPISSNPAGADKPSILVVGAGASQAPFLAALAKEYRLLGTDQNPDAPGKKWLDHFLCVSASDEEDIIRFAHDHEGVAALARVMSFTSGAPQKAACEIARRLEIEGPNPKLVACALSKQKLSEALLHLRLRRCAAQTAYTVDDAVRFLAARTGRFYLKPDRGGGGNGVALVEAPAVSRQILVAVFAAAGDGAIVIEPEALGREYIVTLAVRAGRLSFFSLGLSIKVKDKIGVPVGQILGASQEQMSAPVITFARRWIDAFGLRDGILGFEILLDGGRMTVLDLDLSYNVPVRLALRAGNLSIADCLIGQGNLVDAARFPRASGLMHALAQTQSADAQEISSLVRSLSLRYPDSFAVAEKPMHAFQNSAGKFFRIGSWQLDGADQEVVKEKFQLIARDFYGADIL